jgi:hypothetical protein
MVWPTPETFLIVVEEYVDGEVTFAAFPFDIPAHEKILGQCTPFPHVAVAMLSEKRLSRTKWIQSIGLVKQSCL